MPFKLSPISEQGYPPEGTPVCAFCGHIGVHNEILCNYGADPTKEYSTNVFICNEGCFNLWIFKNQNDFDKASREGGYIYAPWIPMYKTPKVVVDDFIKRRNI